MRIYVFKSETKSELRAFVGDVEGRNLPDQFQPWRAIGMIEDDDDPPHNLSRREIERAIDVHGFQLWRMKQRAKAG